MDEVNFKIQKDSLSNDLKIFVKTEIIEKALQELKRTDKSNLAIIEDTIKILEDGFTIPLSAINPGPGITPDLASALAAPLKAEPINKSAMQEVKVTLPNIKMPEISMEELEKGFNNNMFMGGMR